MSRSFSNDIANYLSVSSLSLEANQSWSFAAYVKLNSASAAQVAVSMADAAAAFEPRHNISLQNSTGFKWRYYENLDSSATSTYWGSGASTGSWVLVVGVLDNAGSTGKIYVGSATPQTGTQGTSTSDTMTRIIIGANADSTPNEPLDGLIAQVAIWEGLALSNSDVTSLLAATNTKDFGAVQSGSLLCHYPLRGDDLSDRTGTLADLSITGSVAADWTDDPLVHGEVYVNDAATLDGGEVLQTYPGAANWSDTQIDMQNVIDKGALTGQLYLIVETATGAVASRAISVGGGGLPDTRIIIPTGPLQA